ncbi:MarR family winged helix-turn-helix transcriptional regulator [Vibrio hippocampi]|uniref:Multiple antibiotic resistance protein MarR n=1 Tax=Vibrio hippocampi TaxID=654686 RepID=A0ABM8ZME8_9VIBR|nr:MarR family transcriptional regulator [Vibrio hippocampi]CAH0529679.1 Multiple antibiotic resistance protein MarR [Vibrio hippocampi]
MKKSDSVARILTKTQDHWPESAAQITPAILRMHRIHTYLHKNLERVLVPYQLQAADFSVLETLRKEAPPHCLSPTQLYSAMLFSSGGLTKVLGRLQQADLIQRLDNPSDKRSKLVQLTACGKQLIDQVIINLHISEQPAINTLSKQEQQTLDSLLTKLLAHWE